MSKNLFIETYGCQMNFADSEVVAAVMQMADYELCDSLDSADAVFINTCSIREHAEVKAMSRLEFFRQLKRKKKNLLVGVIGCMAERMQKELLEHPAVDVVAGPDSYLDLPNLIAQAEQGEKSINVDLSLTETYKDVLDENVALWRIAGHKGWYAVGGRFYVEMDLLRYAKGLFAKEITYQSLLSHTIPRMKALLESRGLVKDRAWFHPQSD